MPLWSSREEGRSVSIPQILMSSLDRCDGGAHYVHGNGFVADLNEAVVVYSID